MEVTLARSDRDVAGRVKSRPATSPLRVLHVTGGFAPAWPFGGPIESLDQLCRHLTRSGCEVRVLTTDTAGSGLNLGCVTTEREMELEPGLRVRYCRRRARISVAPMMLRLLPEYVRWAEIVHLTGIYNFPTIPTLLTCHLLGKPLVWSPRGSLQRFPGRRRPGAKLAWQWMCRRIAPANLILHVTSEAEARESAGQLGERQMALVANGVEIPDLIGNPGPRTGEELRLLFLGRLDPKKGVENLLSACGLLRESGAMALRLTIAGAGSSHYEQSLRALIEKLGLGSMVNLAGDLRGSQKEEAFRAADVLVMPSFAENFGNVVAEALARAVPVIASTGSPWAEVERVGCGLWVDNSPAALADAIRRISTMPMAAMGARGRRWMIEEFGWPSVAKKMLDCYQSALMSGTSPLGIRLAGESPLS